MKRILGLFLAVGLFSSTAFAQVTSSDLIGLGMPVELAAEVASIGYGADVVITATTGDITLSAADDIIADAADDISIQFGARTWAFDAGLNSLEPNASASLGATQAFSVVRTDNLDSGADDLTVDVVDDLILEFGARTWTFDAGLNSFEPNTNASLGATQAFSLVRSTEVAVLGAPTNGGALCTKADGNIGQCTNAVGAGGTCTCA